MKALSVLEPWATLIMMGKNVENRTWPTNHRGPLVICASRVIDPDFDSLDWKALIQHLNARIVVELKLPMSWREFLTVANPGMALGLVDVIGCDEQDTGNKWECPGQWHWRLVNPRPFARPFFQKGQLGIYDVSETAVKNALECLT